MESFTNIKIRKISCDVIQWQLQTFGRSFISLRIDQKRPPHTPDLSPLDFFRWGYVKDGVYIPTSVNTNELKVLIKWEIPAINRETCANVISNFKQRSDVIIAQNGRHGHHRNGNWFTAHTKPL